MKKVLLSVIYPIVLLLILGMLSITLSLFISEVLFPLFEWFNRIHWLLKILLYIVGFSSIMLLIGFFQTLSQLLYSKMLNAFPLNGFTVITTIVLVLANIVYLLIWAWKTPLSYNFWRVLELLFISCVVLSAHSIFFNRRAE